jgi:hypothetical protein
MAERPHLSWSTIMRHWPPLLLSIAVLVAVSPAPANPGPQVKEDDRELHVVFVGQGVTKTGDQIHAAKAAVRVDRPGKMVTLVLCASDAVTWDLTLAPKTRLTRVVLGGREKQAVRGLPPQVDVVEAFEQRPPAGLGGARGRRGGPPALPAMIGGFDQIDTPMFRSMVRSIREITGQEIASFQGARQAERNKPFLVDHVQSDPRLRSDYPQPVPAAEVPKVEFRALDFTTVLPPRGIPRFATSHQASYRDFTLTGPAGADAQRLPPDVISLTLNPATKKMYGLTSRAVVEVDLANNGWVPLDPGPDLPPITRPAGIAFDTKRNRLLVMDRYLYAYDLNAGTWSATELKDFVRPTALAYHPREDAVFALGQSWPPGDDSGALVLYRYDDKGALIEKIRLSEPLSSAVVRPGLLGAGGGTGGPVQMIASGDFLVVLATDRVRSGLQQKLETYIFLVEPKTGKARLTWRAER